MHKISAKNLKPGMKLGQSIHNIEGNLLLIEGTILTDNLIDRLYSLQIPSVYVISNLPDCAVEYPPHIINQKTRTEAIKAVYTTFNKCKLAASFDIGAVQSTIQSIIENIISNKHAIIQASDIRNYDDYTFAHSVNVCTLSTMLAILSNYDEVHLKEIALGALLHDIGKTQIPLEILNKPGVLSDEEMELMKTHAWLGFELLRKTQSFSVVPMHIAFQHHEKYDGSGYPRQLANTEIHEYARIVAIADVYDALTSDRAYKKSCTPDIAYKIMTQYSPGHFDEKLLQIFFDNVAIYPVGTLVKLTFGYYAMVIDVQKNFTKSPSLRLIADQNKRPIKHPAIINLKDSHENYQIERVLEEEELLELLFST